MHPRTFILSLEGLAIASLGPYGCSWNQTPALDAMAARGAVFDRCIVPSDDSSSVLRTLWPGLSRSHRFSVLSDHRPAIELAGEMDCAEVSFIEPAAVDAPAADVLETALAGLLASSLDRLHRDVPAQQAASLLWLHSDFLVRCWDAPRSLLPLEQWAEEDEDEGQPEEYQDDDAATPRVLSERVFQAVQPPAMCWSEDHDPDVTLAWMNTYAAQILLLDELLSALLEAIDDQPTRLILLGTSGFALGENRHFGGHVGPLHSPRIQVPVIGCGPNIPITRCGQPCLPEAALAALLEPSDDGLLSPQSWAAEPEPLQPLIKTRGRNGSLGLTTDAWFYYRDAEQEQLFVKPDDRNDIHNVARRLPDMLEQLRTKA